MSNGINLGSQESVNVLITAFNRPDLLVQAIDNVLNQDIQVRLFVHIDGPRNINEKILTNSCNSVIKNLKHKNLQMLQIEYHSKNLGCKDSMRCALNWFFTNCEYGVVVEDDIILLPGALSASLAMLKLYRNHPEVGQICLHNKLANRKSRTLKYHFSNYPMIWGWATWREKWQLNIDDNGINLESLARAPHTRKLSRQIGKSAYKYWLRKFMTLNFNELNTWDYQWHFTHWKYGWKSLHFNINMSINIGFDNRATHTSTMLNTDILLSDVVFSSIPLDKKIKRDYFSSIWYHDHMISARIFGIPDFIFRPHKFIYTLLPVKVQTSISKFCNLK